MGWNSTLDVCSWTGVYCFNSSGVGRVYWLCASAYQEAVKVLAAPHDLQCRRIC